MMVTVSPSSSLWWCLGEVPWQTPRPHSASLAVRLTRELVVAREVWAEVACLLPHAFLLLPPRDLQASWCRACASKPTRLWHKWQAFTVWSQWHLGLCVIFYNVCLWIRKEALYFLCQQVSAISIKLISKPTSWPAMLLRVLSSSPRFLQCHSAGGNRGSRGPRGFISYLAIFGRAKSELSFRRDLGREVAVTIPTVRWGTKAEQDEITCLEHIARKLGRPEAHILATYAKLHPRSWNQLDQFRDCLMLSLQIYCDSVKSIYLFFKLWTAIHDGHETNLITNFRGI